MAYGNLTNTYTNPYGYMNGSFYNNGFFNPALMQNLQAQPQQQYDAPIQGVIFLTSDEAKAYIVPPNKRMLIMDRDKSIFYIKSANALGQSDTTAYRFEQIKDDEPKVEVEEVESTPVVTDEYVKKVDIENFVSTTDLQNLKAELETTIDNIEKTIIGKVLGDDKK